MPTGGEHQKLAKVGPRFEIHAAHAGPRLEPARPCRLVVNARHPFHPTMHLALAHSLQQHRLDRFLNHTSLAKPCGGLVLVDQVELGVDPLVGAGLPSPAINAVYVVACVHPPDTMHGPVARSIGDGVVGCSV